MGQVIQHKGQRVAQIGRESAHGGGEPIGALRVFCDLCLTVCFPIAPAVCGASVAGLSAAAVMGGVDGDAVEPGGNLRASAKTGEFGREGRADVLGQILGVVFGASQAKAEAKQAIILARGQGRERLFVALLGRHGQGFIAGCHTHH